MTAKPRDERLRMSPVTPRVKPMRKSLLLILASLCILAAVYASLAQNGTLHARSWTIVAPGVLRSPGGAAGYALVHGDRALLIDAPVAADGLAAHGVRKIEAVLLTHYHRDVCAALPALLKTSAMRAPVKAAEWLEPDRVRKYWRDSIPLRGSRTAYRVVPEGFAGIDYSLVDGKTIAWHGWQMTIIDTPGHALAHVAIAARNKDGPRVVFCGGAFASAGKLWAPYTTDWDHWTDAGLKPAAASLRRLIAQKPDVLCPTHGPVVTQDVEAALKKTLAAVEDAGFLKSFERYTKERIGNPPSYRFLAKEQAQSNGSKPWSRVSEHLWLTGNTYVLTSKDGPSLLIDPWDKRSAEQFAKLQKEQGVGPLEVVMFSHAHYDHYDGIYHLPDRDKFAVWTLDTVSRPLAEPARWRAPFLDIRPVKFDKTPRPGETLTWREYRFRFHHLPGQTYYTMGVEATIDGKTCYFTADNFFHQDMFSGTGGWMGLNRSSPLMYAASAQQVLDARPEWVLAEHGGPFEFSAEDFRRRVDWGRAAARATDALCPSGDHRADWDPSRVHVEPLLQKAKPGATINATLVVTNPLPRKETLTAMLDGRGLTPDQTWELEVGPSGTAQRAITVQLADNAPAGRQVFALRAADGERVEQSDAFFVVDVER
jgi:glyoxylase-like metal-dependent hydrolase (beta-lactamase superfamily II)